MGPLATVSRTSARAFLELGAFDRVCEKVDLLLSGSMGSATGEILRDFDNEALRHYKPFEAVLRKHAWQLKDPTILDGVFGKKT